MYQQGGRLFTVHLLTYNRIELFYSESFRGFHVMTHFSFCSFYYLSKVFQYLKKNKSFTNGEVLNQSPYVVGNWLQMWFHLISNNVGYRLSLVNDQDFQCSRPRVPSNN